MATECVVRTREIVRFIEHCMMKVGAPAAHASQLADNLVAADLRGHFSHGLNRLEMYVGETEKEMTSSNHEPTIERETESTALVNGHNVLGPVVGNFSMKTAIDKCKKTGVGWVAAKGSNHFGIAGYYSIRAADENLIGMCFTNTSPVVFPTRAKQAVLGTNPIAVAAKGLDGDNFVLDMATSTSALGKVELAAVKETAVPDGWGADSHGKQSNDPGIILNEGGLLPLGGTEASGGYKGYGLALMVELFCGVLAGACFGPNIRNWKSSDRDADLGQCFVAIDPSAFGDGFHERLQCLMDLCRAQEPAEAGREVLIPGDPERKHMAKCEKLGGIPYHENQIKNAVKLAERLNVSPLETL